MSEEGSANGDNRIAELPIFTTRRLVQTAIVVLLLLGAIYFLFPKLVGLGDALSRLDDADPLWIAVAMGFNVLAYATYIALFKAVVSGDALRLSWLETYEINMAGVAATLLFSAGGAGGVALTYWALRKAGMARRDVGRRMVAFVSLHYVFYPIALILFGVLLRTGVMNGKGSVELTIVPAAVAGLLLVLGALITLIPSDVESRLAPLAHGERSRHLLASFAKVPATLGEGFRFALGLFAHPSRGGLAVIGAAGFWAASIGVLWASFHAFGVHVPLAVVVQGYFLGMVANLFPLAPAGVGAVDAGMIGAFVLFGFPSETVFPAILIFRLVSFWMPIPPGVFAFFQLRHTVHRWEEEGLPIDRGGTATSDLEPAVG
ncbi:MAG TPA: lysylphosphatidylglycerol synthase transmembrane domain-containing protein [Solirubrobacterales bacterium]|nr:lysylphosphatidylglycerol synthase transmembrane domain-containing protein [Solirubrobacterales bacterium]